MLIYTIVHIRVSVVISNGLRAAAARRYAKSNPPPTTTLSCISSLHVYSYIQQSGRSVKSMNAKNTEKTPIHENADVNITCDFGDGDISRSRSRLLHGQTASHILSLIIVDSRTYHHTCCVSHTDSHSNH